MKKSQLASKTGPSAEKLLVFIAASDGPTQKAMAEHMGLQRGAIRNLLNVLEAQGRVSRDGRGIVTAMKDGTQ